MVRSFYPSHSISALFYGHLKLVKATEKGKKSKQGFKVTPGNQTRNFHTEGCTFTDCANWRDYPVFYTIKSLDYGCPYTDQIFFGCNQDNRTSAATTIQAAFRGHSVRQGLNWKLPSGRTLRSTVRQGLHQRSRILGTGASESSQYSTAWDNDDKSSISDINTSYSSARSKVKSPTHSSRSLKVLCLQRYKSMRMSGVLKNFKPFWKFHTSLKNLNQFKKIQTKQEIWTTTYVWTYPPWVNFQLFFQLFIKY